MRARFFGATSYDDEITDDEPVDLSGFIGSDMSGHQPNPVVVERKRGNGLGNAGATQATPPPPMSSIGYTLPQVESASANEGSSFNPLWANDNSSFGKPYITVGTKITGVLLTTAGVSSMIASRSLFKGLPGKMTAGGLALYLHPSLGWSHGAIDKNSFVDNRGPIGQVVLKGAIHVVGAGAFYAIWKKTSR